MTKDEEKTEVLSTLSQFLTVRQFFSQVIQPLELEDRDREYNEASIMKAEKVSNLLHHVDVHKYKGMNGTHPRELTEVTESLTRISLQPCLTGEIPVD